MKICAWVNESESAELQNLAFGKGYSWACDSKHINHPKYPKYDRYYLYLDDTYMKLSHCDSPKYGVLWSFEDVKKMLGDKGNKVYVLTFLENSSIIDIFSSKEAAEELQNRLQITKKGMYNYTKVTEYNVCTSPGESKHYESDDSVKKEILHKLTPFERKILNV